MNNIQAEYNLETPSLTLKVTAEVIPKMGIDINGTYQKASWGNAAQALAIFLDGLEASQADLIEAIESDIGKDIDGNNDGVDPESED
jgi:hypothetical protein